MISDDTTAGRRYHHNSDFSGEVWIVMDEAEVEHDQFSGRRFVIVKIPVQDILDIADEARAATEDPNYDDDRR